MVSNKVLHMIVRCCFYCYSCDISWRSSLKHMKKIHNLGFIILSLSSDFSNTVYHKIWILWRGLVVWLFLVLVCDVMVMWHKLKHLKNVCELGIVILVASVLIF
jgi:hypothetical protein